MPARPNVLVVISHDTGRHVSPYGIETVHTPNAERLAAEGVLFEQMFCTAPQCSPSRAGLFTGLAPHATGVHGLTHSPFDFDLHPTVRHAASYFREQGYATFASGTCHETHSLQDQGFDEISKDRDSLTISDTFRAWLRGRGESGRPFFAELATFQTHRPFPTESIAPDDSLGVTVPPPLSPTEQTRADFAALQGSVKQWDEGLGRLLAMLDEEGIAEDTLLFVTTDHGTAMPFAKCTLFDRGIGVLGFMRYPAGGISGGRRYRELLSNLDVLPTLLEAGGQPLPGGLHGRSFLPLLQGGAYEANEAVFAEMSYHSYYKPMRCVRTERYKYVRHFTPAVNHMVPTDVMAGGAYRDNLDLLLRYRLTGPEELYDVENDPDEGNDLAGEAEHKSALEDCRGRLARWMRDTADPLLVGAVESPLEQEGRASLRALAGLQ